jgi:hypothetical protein
MSRGEGAIRGKFRGILRGFNSFVALSPSPFPTAWARGEPHADLFGVLKRQLQRGGSFASALHSPPRRVRERGWGARRCAHRQRRAEAPLPHSKTPALASALGGSFASALHKPLRQPQRRAEAKLSHSISPSPRAGEGDTAGEGKKRVRLYQSRGQNLRKQARSTTPSLRFPLQAGGTEPMRGSPREAGGT